MKAVWYERTGAAHEVLTMGEMSDPNPDAGEVRVRMSVAGVNPSDVKRRAGFNGQTMAFPRIIPNMDGAGTIDAVGAGVDAKRIGERVWLHSTAWKRPFGTAAQYAVTPSPRAFTLPMAVSFEVGAGLGVPAMTAHRAVFGCGAVRGKTVLVPGGAGAVGFYAIQLAKWGGATVIATVSGAAKAAEALRAGADHVVNYRVDNVADRVMALSAGAGVDHIVEVDFGANLASSLAVIKPNGSLATYASMTTPQPSIAFYAWMNKNVQLLWVFVYEMSQAAMDEAARDVNAWLVSGHAQHPKVHPYPLERAADAHGSVEAAAVGKVVINIGAM